MMHALFELSSTFITASVSSDLKIRSRFYTSDQSLLVCYALFNLDMFSKLPHCVNS